MGGMGYSLGGHREHVITESDLAGSMDRGEF